MRPWVYCDKELSEAPDNQFGFVYLITNLKTGKKYLGCKQLKKVVKGKSKDSDWSSYYGSSRELKEDIKALGHNAFHRLILQFCSSRSELLYNEAREIMVRNAIIDPQYYNRWLSIKTTGYGDKNPRIGTKASEETRAKLSKAKKGKPKSEEHRAKLSAANKGKPKPPRSEETRAKISAACKGKPKPHRSEEHRAKISAACKGKPKPHRRGELNPKAKLLNRECTEIIDLYTNKIYNQNELAVLYGVVQSRISRIIKKWNSIS